MIKRILKDPEGEVAKQMLNSHERAQLLLAIALDGITSSDQRQQILEADQFERSVVEWFADKDVRLQTQVELEKEQKDNFGR